MTEEGKVDVRAVGQLVAADDEDWNLPCTVRELAMTMHARDVVNF